MRTLIVVPTYNEVENAEPLARAILAAVPTVDLLFVDDNSPDGTGQLVRKMAAADRRVLLLARPGKLGLGTAYLAGYRYGLEHGYDVVVTMDADFSHDPRYLPALLAGLEARDGAPDVMIGSRYVPGGGVKNWGLHRRLLSRFANFYARTLLGLTARDCTAGFRAYRTEVLRHLPLGEIRSSGYSFLEEVLYLVHLAGFRVGETPIIFEDRRAGRSKISRKEIFRAALTVLRLKWKRPAVAPRPAAQSRA
ncbi:MAG: polyprenol monophosphomannose synthase [Planctomycetes bacterium]|nr:polyprenol monophosphomannose synthase [Planctomycetota bacterium]